MSDMSKQASKIKKLTLEPRVYALLVKSAMGQVMHLGVHYSLDEAYGVARTQLEKLVQHAEGESVDIDMWHSIPARDMLPLLVDKSGMIDHFQKKLPIVQEHAGTPDVPPADLLKTILERHLSTTQKFMGQKKPKSKSPKRTEDAVKNDLMRKLISDGDMDAVEKAKKSLSKTEIQFVVSQITKHKDDSK